MMLTTDLTEAKYVLRKALITEGSDLVLNHLWIWEIERWKELVFALLTRTINISEEEVRVLVNNLEELELLDINSLAALYKGDSSPNLEDSTAQHILELFQEKGLSTADAQRGLTVICEVALGLQQNYGGKIQRYLRHYGQLMLRDIQQSFHFNELNQSVVEEAFTYWLQNVLNMPLSLTDENVQIFCKENNLSVVELFAAADELDMNFALLDDLVERHELVKKAKKDGENKTTKTNYS